MKRHTLLADAVRDLRHGARLLAKAPVAVLVRATLERTVAPAARDGLYPVTNPFRAIRPRRPGPAAVRSCTAPAR